MPTLAERVCDLLEVRPGASDREITDALLGPGQPQQPVNQVCRRLNLIGRIDRKHREDGRIGNYLTETKGNKVDLPAAKESSERFVELVELGSGGMGVVFSARDTELNEVVALKALKPEFTSDPYEVERFKNELKLARKIAHPNVCRMYDLHRLDNRFVLAMEYIEGESLRDLVSGHGVPMRVAVRWAIQLCDALNAAHALNIVHRDLKPENVMVDVHDQVKVMDFGIARLIQSQTAKTGTFVGTPAYMSPEQIGGHQLDARSDIYSAGVLLYELFAGRHPFGDENVGTLLYKHIHQDPAPLRSVDGFVPSSAETIVARRMKKNRDERYNSVVELKSALIQLGFRPDVNQLPPKVAATPASSMHSVLDEFLGSTAQRRTAGWYYTSSKEGRGVFLAFVNAKGSCSVRMFDAESGGFLRKEYRRGNYEDAFASLVSAGVKLPVSIRVNLERDCKDGLPTDTLRTLQQASGTTERT